MEKPRHLKTQSFIHKKLFENITGFNELESRISALPTKQERGDAFEVFAEAYLATQKWVHKQRQKRRNNQLSEEQIRRLDQIGLIWNPSDSTWEEKFAELLIYKEINGHCNVPNHWSKNQQYRRMGG